MATLFVELWTRHQADVRRYVFMLLPRPADVDDVIQETAISLLDKFADYDAERPFLPWATRFAYLEVLKWRQHHARSGLIYSEDLLAKLEATITEESPMLEIRRQALDGCLLKLGNRERGLLLSRYSKLDSLQQEANRTGVSVHKLYYAVEKIRAALLKCIKTTLTKEGWDYV